MNNQKNQYDDDNIPEIDLPGKANATDEIPYEMPGKDSVEKSKE